MKLDKIDLRLLKLLQDDSRLTHKELSGKLGLSITAIYERVKKLERERVITNYVALVNKKAVNLNFIAFCHVRLSQHTRNNVTQFEKQVVKLTEVLECHHISGDYDYILKVVVESMEAYRYFMVNKLTTLSQIGSTHSTFIISEVKHSTAIPV